MNNYTKFDFYSDVYTFKLGIEMQLPKYTNAVVESMML